jgi:hypothetical protein
LLKQCCYKGLLDQGRGHMKGGRGADRERQQQQNQIRGGKGRETSLSIALFNTGGSSEGGVAPRQQRRPGRPASQSNVQRLRVRKAQDRGMEAQAGMLGRLSKQQCHHAASEGGCCESSGENTSPALIWRRPVSAAARALGSPDATAAASQGGYACEQSIRACRGAAPHSWQASPRWGASTTISRHACMPPGNSRQIAAARQAGSHHQDTAARTHPSCASGGSAHPACRKTPGWPTHLRGGRGQGEGRRGGGGGGVFGGGGLGRVGGL